MKSTLADPFRGGKYTPPLKHNCAFKKVDEKSLSSAVEAYYKTIMEPKPIS